MMHRQLPLWLLQHPRPVLHQHTQGSSAFHPLPEPWVPPPPPPNPHGVCHGLAGGGFDV